MEQRYYTYRVCITDRERVRVSKYDPQYHLRGEPTGGFGYRDELEERIKELHQAASSDELTDRNSLKELGEALFVALFDEALHIDFISYYREARRNSAILRLELDVDESQLPDVAALPWEFMRTPDKPRHRTFWLGTASDLVFSRRCGLWEAADPIRLEPGERLRIALAVAEPQGLPRVKYEEILGALQQLERDHAEKIELLPLANPATADSIDRVLRQRPHIFHFIGHGELKRDSGHISLVDVAGRQDPVDAVSFGELFNRHDGCIVILQACEGAASSSSQAYVSVASRVVQQNIPVVVAMQFEVTNHTAKEFALEFYERIVHNDPVDKAVQEARFKIARSTSYRNRDFATPVLFMRVRDGRLFDMPLGEPDYAGRSVTSEAPALGNGAKLQDDYFAGLSHLLTDEYEKALEMFLRVAQVDPDYRDVKGRMEEARRKHERHALETSLQSAEASADWNIAIAALKRLIELFPDDPALPDRLAYAETQMQLQTLWEETAELVTRKSWRAVVRSFEKMRAIDPNLADKQNWLAPAEEALRQEENERLVRLHLREATEFYDQAEWRKSLNALISLLKLDPKHETAIKLRTRAQEALTRAEAATLLAERYDKASRAIADEDWVEAVDQLKAIGQQAFDYRDVNDLLEHASEQLANLQAKLDIKLLVKPNPVEPDSDAIWTLTVRNDSLVTIFNIVATSGKGKSPLEKPFDLNASDSRKITFTTHHSTQGTTRHILVEGTTPSGQRIQAKSRVSVSIIKPSSVPVQGSTPQTTVPSRVTAKAGPSTSTSIKPTGVSSIRPKIPDYVIGLRRVKEATQFDDFETQGLTDLFQQGVRHYRAAIRAAPLPRNWDKQVTDWLIAVAKLKESPIEMIPFAPKPETILRGINVAKGEIKRRVGVDIPLQDLIPR